MTSVHVSERTSRRWSSLAACGLKTTCAISEAMMMAVMKRSWSFGDEAEALPKPAKTAANCAESRTRTRDTCAMCQSSKTSK